MPYRLRNLVKTVAHLENYPLRVAEMLRLLPARPALYRLRNGLRFWVRPGTSDGSCVVDVTRENEYFKYFRVMPGDTVIDIGANIGSFSVFAAWLEPTSRVLCAEPLHENFALLQRNIEANGLKNVESLKVAVMAEAGEIVIYHGSDQAEGSSSVLGSDVVDASRGETVRAISFADLMARVERCDFLKIDCEGAEFDFLLSAAAADLRKVRKIVMEYHDLHPTLTHKDLVAKLEGADFRVIVEPHGPNFPTGLLYAIAL
jgi:FkbM family methyltransferase